MKIIKTYEYTGNLSFFIKISDPNGIAILMSLKGNDFYLDEGKGIVFGIRTNTDNTVDVFIECCYLGQGYSNKFYVTEIITLANLELFLDKMSRMGIQFDRKAILDDYHQLSTYPPVIGQNRELYEIATRPQLTSNNKLINGHQNLPREIEYLTALQNRYSKQENLSWISHDISLWIDYFKEIQILKRQACLSKLELIINQMSAVQPYSKEYNYLLKLPRHSQSYKLKVSDFGLTLNNIRIKSIEIIDMYKVQVIVVDYQEDNKNQKYFFNFPLIPNLTLKDVFNIFIELGCFFDCSLRDYAIGRINPKKFDGLAEYNNLKYPKNEVINNYSQIHHELWLHCENALIQAREKNIKNVSLLFLASGKGEEIDVFINGISCNPLLWNMNIVIYGIELGSENVEFTRARFKNLPFVTIYQYDLSEISTEILKKMLENSCNSQLIFSIISGFLSRKVNTNPLEALKILQPVAIISDLIFMNARTPIMLPRHTLNQMGVTVDQIPFYWNNNYSPTFIIKKRDCTNFPTTKPDERFDLVWNIQVLTILNNLLSSYYFFNTVSFNLSMSYIPKCDYAALLIYFAMNFIQSLEITGEEKWYKDLQVELKNTPGLKINLVSEDEYYIPGLGEIHHSPYFYKSIHAIKTTPQQNHPNMDLSKKVS